MITFVGGGGVGGVVVGVVGVGVRISFPEHNFVTVGVCMFLAMTRLHKNRNSTLFRFFELFPFDWFL